MVAFESLITISIIVLSGILIDGSDKIVVFKMMVLCSLIVIPRGMILFILQGTNRIKEYAQATLIEKISYCCLIVLLILLGIKEYQIMIAADIIGKSISLIYAVYSCKDIVFRNINTFYFSFSETVENIKVGIKVAFAYVASTLIVGIVRFGIEHTWDVETFGKVSLTLSVSNLMMVFINAVGLIMFPVLKRTEESKLPDIYKTMRTFLTVPLLGILAFYYPLKVIMSAWLPQYAESLTYMALIFPLCLYEGKMALLINTYLKTLRKEKLLLIINVVSFVLSLILTGVFAIVLKDLTFSVMSIMILLAFRCVLAELFIARVLNISLNYDIVLELLLTLVFMLTGWVIGSWQGIIIYLAAYIVYVFIKHRDIVETIRKVQSLIKA
jgi:O-antigen/teichoic acid export membrane protein